MYKGSIKNWNGNKGFGFIQCEELNKDIFVHITALKSMARAPILGDIIFFDVANQPNGKSKAINCHIEGVLTKPQKVRKVHMHKSTKPKSRLMLILLVVAIVAFGYQRMIKTTVQYPIQVAPTHVIETPNRSFSCDKREYCSQMNSRAEAEFFIKHCPNTKMDGDNDGIPCENDSRF